MVWTLVEVVILFVIFLVCLRRRKPDTSSSDIQELLQHKPLEPDPNIVIVTPRRNSFGGRTKLGSSVVKSLGKTLQKYKSETALGKISSRLMFNHFTPTDLYGMFLISKRTIPFWILRVERVHQKDIQIYLDLH